MIKYSKAIVIGILLFGFTVYLFQDAYASQGVTLDRQTYPIPNDGMDLKISIRITDPDFNISPNGIDTIANDVDGKPGVGPIKISIVRGDSVVLGYAGGQKENNGKIDSLPLANTPEEQSAIRQFGPIKETSPQSGIFEFELTLKNTDGPESAKCPEIQRFSGIKEADGASEVRFDDTSGASRHCILQGDVLVVEYTDPVDFSGYPRKDSVSAKFSLSNPSIGSSSTSFRIGHPFTLILSDFDLNLDSEKAESYPLDLLTFRSEKIRINLGEKSAREAFDPKPSALRETGDNTGVFYTVLKIPRSIDGKIIHIGDKIEFEYRDVGTIASGFVGQTTEKFTLKGQTGIKSEGNSPNSNFLDEVLNRKSIEKKSPLMQFHNGVQIDEIQCPGGFELVMKKSNGLPACISTKNLDSLIQRGWAKRI